MVSDLVARTGRMEAGVATTYDDYVRARLPTLVRYAALLCGDVRQAEDLVQDVLVWMWPRWEELEPRLDSVDAYARRAITNRYLSWRRRWHTRHVVTVQTEKLDRATDAAVDMDDELWHDLRKLPHKQRAALVLRYYEGLDDAEIAEVLGCRRTTVRSHIHRGLAALRVALDAPYERKSP